MVDQGSGGEWALLGIEVVKHLYTKPLQQEQQRCNNNNVAKAWPPNRLSYEHAKSQSLCSFLWTQTTLEVARNLRLGMPQ